MSGPKRAREVAGRVVRGVDAWYRPQLAPERIASLRILIGAYATVYLLVRLPHLVALGSLGGFRPVGIVSLLSSPLSSGAQVAQALLAVALGVAFTLGFRFRATGPAFALLFLWVLTYRNSFGMIFHTENLNVMHVLVLGSSRSADVWSLDARSCRTPVPQAASRYGWPVQLLAVVTVGTYFLAGVAKLRLSGLDWGTAEQLRNFIAHDNLRKLLLGSVHSPLGGWLVQHGWIFPPLAFASLMLELAAPIALWGPRTAWSWAILAWCFHAGVLAVMAIVFPYPLLGIAFLPLFAADELPVFRRWRRPTSDLDAGQLERFDA